MNGTDQFDGTDVRPGAPTSGDPSDGSVTESDGGATTRAFAGLVDRSIDRVTP